MTLFTLSVPRKLWLLNRISYVHSQKGL